MVFADRLKSYIESDFPGLMHMYQELHAHPELSGQEKETARRVAESFSRMGAEVTTAVGGAWGCGGDPKRGGAHGHDPRGA